MLNSEQKIDAFAQSARKFCRWIEKSPSDAKSETRLALSLLTEVYNKALQLPKIKSSVEVTTNETDDAEIKRLYRRCGSLPINYYSKIFDPLISPSEEPVVGDLADDLTGVYRDLKRGLDIYNSGQKRTAAWEWQLHFNIHWGRHLVAALYPLHCQTEKDWDAAILG